MFKAFIFVYMLGRIVLYYPSFFIFSLGCSTEHLQIFYLFFRSNLSVSTDKKARSKSYVPVATALPVGAYRPVGDTLVTFSSLS